MADTESQNAASAQKFGANWFRNGCQERPSAGARCQEAEREQFQCKRGKPERLAEAGGYPAGQNNKYTRAT